MDFNVYEQRPPIGGKGEFQANMVNLGKVQARNMQDAMKVAKLKTKWPALHPLNSHGFEL